MANAKEKHFQVYWLKTKSYIKTSAQKFKHHSHHSVLVFLFWLKYSFSDRFRNWLTALKWTCEQNAWHKHYGVFALKADWFWIGAQQFGYGDLFVTFDKSNEWVILWTAEYVYQRRYIIICSFWAKRLSFRVGKLSECCLSISFQREWKRIFIWIDHVQ